MRTLMKCNVLAAAIVLLLPGLLCAEDDEHMHDHQKMEAVSPTDPPIKITINPEARVSVALAGALPRPVPCGTPADLSVKVINQGFVTSRLEAEFVGGPPAGVGLDFNPEPLKGTPEERRSLRITLFKPASTDLTIAFRTHNNAP